MGAEFFFEAGIAAGIGMVAGMFAGMLGIGGGAIMAPLLLFVFEARGMDPGDAALSAIATSITAILFTSLPSLVTHALHKSVVWRYFAWIGPVAFVCAILSTWIATLLPTILLIMAIAIYLGVSCVKMLYTKTVERNAKDVVALRPSQLAGIAALSGLIGPMTGTGGGIVVSSAMVHFRQPLILAIGTSSSTTFVVAVAGTLGFAGQESLVDLPSLVGIASTCMVMSVVGARMANIMPRRKLQLVYVAMIGVIVARLAYRAVVL